MRKIVSRIAPAIFCIFCCFSQAQAQELLGNVGIGVGYDAFLPDKNVLEYNNKWPFQLSPQAVVGLRFGAKNGFDFFMDAGVGITRIQFPVPDENKSGNFLNQFNLRFMAGSGPRMELNEKSAIIPFIQLGGGYYGNWGNAQQQNNNSDISITTTKDVFNSRWVVLAGGGIDWEFYAYVPSSINLQFTYTPMNIFENPIAYTATTPKATTTDLMLQGKLLQVMFTFRVYLSLKKWDEYRQYY